MKRHIKTLPALLVAIAVVALTAAGAFAGEDRYVEFRGRKIDLKPYFEGFPYSDFTPVYDAGRIFYYHEGDTRTLRSVALSGGSIDLAAGQVISDIDFSKRNVWGVTYNPRDKHLYWSGDEKNDEIINLYRLNPENKELEKLTDVPYIYGWHWDEEYKNVAYVARVGHREERLGQLRLLNLETGEESIIVEDTPEMRFTWTSPSWQQDGKGVVIAMLKDADRAFGNLAWVDFETKEVKILTDTAQKRSWPHALERWLSPNEFVYISNEDGFQNAYKYNIKSGQSSQLTKFDRDLGEADVVEMGGKRYLFCIIESPIDNELVLVDPNSGKVLKSEKVDVNVGIYDSDENKLLVSITAATEKFRVDEIKLDARKGFAFGNVLTIPKELREKIVHASVKKINYPTFDIDPATGKTRTLHAFLYTPKKVLPADQRIVMIQSFYGGGNYFSTRTHILGEAGIYVLSPSPRGSTGFGREFAALNDKDLGGNEIIDVIYAARWAQEHLGVPPERIGVYGGSHGGYATMRCLTFPGDINGNKADFNWGFGMSHAGFSDIIDFYEFCNIPDWVILEAGDPKTEAAKLRDRSPLYHADKARGKLLLTHGTNDSRVPIAGSRAMADSLRAYGKDVTLIEFEGQGHGIKGLENQIHFYKTWFEFLEGVGAGERASN